MDPKDEQENSTSFDTNLMSAVGRRKKLYTQNRQKIDLRGSELGRLSTNRKNLKFS